MNSHRQFLSLPQGSGSSRRRSWVVLTVYMSRRNCGPGSLAFYLCYTRVIPYPINTNFFTPSGNVYLTRNSLKSIFRSICCHTHLTVANPFSPHFKTSINEHTRIDKKRLQCNLQHYWTTPSLPTKRPITPGSHPPSEEWHIWNRGKFKSEVLNN